MRMMNEFESDDAFGGDGISIAFRDMLIAALVAMAAVMFYLLAATAAAKQQEQTKAETLEPIESLQFEAIWNHQDPMSANKPYPNKLIDADVDMGIWFRGGPDLPALSPVWFTNMGAGFVNLLRDDYGNRPGIEAEYDPVNYENAKTRGIPAGEYCVNVHLYRNASSLTKIPVTVNMRRTKGEARKLLDGRMSAPTSADKPLVTKTVVLERVWQEVNAFCFTMDKNFELVGKPYSTKTLCFPDANTTQCR